MPVIDWSEKGLEDSDLIKLYDVRNDAQYEKLYLSYNKLTSLPDLRTFGHFSSLKVLTLRDNNIKNIDFSLIPTTLTELVLSGNKLTHVGGLSQYTELKDLYISSNQITYVDWRNLPPALTRLYLDKNQLTTVGDVRQCIRLSELYVDSNHINLIDWRNLPLALKRLRLDNNELTTVDVIHCTQLEYLDLSDNPTLHSIQSIPNTDFDFSIDSSVKVLGRKCFHENTCNMMQEKCEELKWKLEQPPVEVLFQGLEAVIEYYTEKSIKTTHTR